MTTTRRVTVLGCLALLSALSAAGCKGKEEAPIQMQAAPPPPPTASAPVKAGDGGGSAPDVRQPSKLAPAVNDGLSLADRMAKRKADEEKIAAENAAAEKERLIAYDKGKLGQHAAVAAFIQKTRKALDDGAAKAKGKADAKDQIEKLRASQLKAIEAQGKIVRAIDPKGGNSNIVTDEDVSLGILAREYPDALEESLAGSEAALHEQSAELDKRMKKMTEWIDEVKKAPKPGKPKK